MRRWSRTSRRRLIHRSQSPPPIMDEIQDENILGQLNPPIDHGDNQCQYDQNQPRTLKDYINLTRIRAPSRVVFLPKASRFNFKPNITQVLPTYGLEYEKLYLHLRDFVEVCNTFTY